MGLFTIWIALMATEGTLTDTVGYGNRIYLLVPAGLDRTTSPLAGWQLFDVWRVDRRGSGWRLPCATYRSIGESRHCELRSPVRTASSRDLLKRRLLSKASIFFWSLVSCPRSAMKERYLTLFFAKGVLWWLGLNRVAYLLGASREVGRSYCRSPGFNKADDKLAHPNITQIRCREDHGPRRGFPILHFGSYHFCGPVHPKPGLWQLGSEDLLHL